MPATSRLRARYAWLRAAYPPTAEWPDKRCYYVARTLDDSEDGYERHGRRDKANEVGAAKANRDAAVQAMLVRLREQRGREFFYSADAVLTDLWRATEMALGAQAQQRAVIVQDKRVIDTETGETQTVVRAEQLEVRNTELGQAKALLELWAKHYGLIRERLEADVALGMPDLSDAELAGQLKALGMDVSLPPAPDALAEGHD